MSFFKICFYRVDKIQFFSLIFLYIIKLRQDIFPSNCEKKREIWRKLKACEADFKSESARNVRVKHEFQSQTDN